MEAITALFNIVVVVMIVSTMLVAGLSSTVSQLLGTFRNVVLVLLVLLANLLVVPLIGWGVAEVLSLSTASYIALVLIASSPGAPFGAKLAMIQKGDLIACASMQVLLAALGSVTFPITANLIIQAAGLGDSVELPVGDLIKTVVFLQLLPFAVGLCLRNWADHAAAEWLPPVSRISNITFPLVLVLALFGSWQQLIDLVGSSVLLAAALLALLSVLAGSLLSSGSKETRTSMGTLAPMRNAGPVMAAVAIAFDNDPAILAAVTGINLIVLVVALPVASYLSRGRAAAGEATVQAPADQSPPLNQPRAA